MVRVSNLGVLYILASFCGCSLVDMPKIELFVFFMNKELQFCSGCAKLYSSNERGAGCSEVQKSNYY